jgi:hypothetical protein
VTWSEPNAAAPEEERTDRYGRMDQGDWPHERKTSEDIEERRSQFVTSGAVSLSLTKTNKLKAVRSCNY